MRFFIGIFIKNPRQHEIEIKLKAKIATEKNRLQKSRKTLYGKKLTTQKKNEDFEKALQASNLKRQRGLN